MYDSVKSLPTWAQNYIKQIETENYRLRKRKQCKCKSIGDTIEDIICGGNLVYPEYADE